MSLLKPESVLHGFVIGPCIYSGAMAHIYSVHCADGAPDCADPGFPMVMKVPRMSAEDGAETIVSFEVEHQLLPLLSGPHVPRFVAAGRPRLQSQVREDALDHRRFEACERRDATARAPASSAPAAGFARAPGRGASPLRSRAR